jgi:uncharacterized protein with von Willebrand factor type A (vWA) domain
MRAIEVLTTLGMGEPDSLYWGLRLTMVRRIEHLDTFDETFRQYWESPLGSVEPELPAAAARRERGDPSSEYEDESARPTSPLPPLGRSRGEAPEERDAESDDDAEAAETVVYSAVEVIADKSFAEYTPGDREHLLDALARLRSGGPWRTSRRMRSHRRGAVDIRSTVRSSFRTEGHPVTLARRQPQRKQRRLVFVCDVSGSMEPYALAVLALAHVALGARRRVEVLAFATRLTRITSELVEHDPTAAMAAAVDTVVDWAGGTRMGACLAELNRLHRQILQGSVVVIASDGWDLGDPRELSPQAGLLQRVAYRVVWINPRLEDPAFEPLTRGMSAALPYVDHFLSCHNFKSFVELLDVLDRI